MCPAGIRRKALRFSVLRSLAPDCAVEGSGLCRYVLQSGKGDVALQDPVPEIGLHVVPRYTAVTVTVPFWLEIAMPTTLTLKNIPDQVYERLKAAAEAHRRSLNSEAIMCLETVLTPTRIAPSERLARARELRAGITATFRARDIDALKRQGRP